MKITFLGTGTSQGVPVIGCDCEVCLSSNPLDHRLRTSMLVSTDDFNIAIDAGPDFRQQMLRANVKDLEAILVTHEHNDHIIGMDDVRPFNFRSGKDMAVYSTTAVEQQLKERFAYVFAKSPYPGIPQLQLHSIQAGEQFRIKDLDILPIEVMHGKMPVLAFRFGDFTYITDAKTIAPESLELLKGTKILVINALHHKTHYSHLNLEEALEMIEKINPEQSYLTHISHRMGLAEAINPQLPAGIRLAHDGLVLNI